MEELVIKCSLFDDATTTNEIENAYNDIFAESSLLKLNPIPALAEIKEELVEFNPDLNLIISYSVVIERAQNSLQDLFKTWSRADLAKM